MMIWDDLMPQGIVWIHWHLNFDPSPHRISVKMCQTLALRYTLLPCCWPRETIGQHFHLAAAQHHGCVLDNGALVGLCEHCSVCVLICTDGDLGTKNWVDFTRWKWLCISTKTTFLTVKLVKSTFLLVKTQILVVKPHFAVGGGWIFFFGLCWKPSCRTFGCLSFGYPSRKKDRKNHGYLQLEVIYKEQFVADNISATEIIFLPLVALIIHRSMIALTLSC